MYIYRTDEVGASYIVISLPFREFVALNILIYYTLKDWTAPVLLFTTESTRREGRQLNFTLDWGYLCVHNTNSVSQQGYKIWMCHYMPAAC